MFQVSGGATRKQTLSYFDNTWSALEAEAAKLLPHAAWHRNRRASSTQTRGGTEKAAAPGAHATATHTGLRYGLHLLSQERLPP